MSEAGHNNDLTRTSYYFSYVWRQLSMELELFCFRNIIPYRYLNCTTLTLTSLLILIYFLKMENIKS